MEKKARAAVPFAMLAIALLLAGCISQDSGNAAVGRNGKQMASQAGAQSQADENAFLVPESEATYTAYYIVNEGGQETGKMVWRMGRNMRIDLGDGNATVSVFFLENRTYSCANSPFGGYGCFDITQQAIAQGTSSLIDAPDLSGAKEAETVPIGQAGKMTAKCYVFSSAPVAGRKMCFTEGGILAYDEYALSGGKKHVEYLANLRFSADEKDFALPATPMEIPAGAQS